MFNFDLLLSAIILVTIDFIYLNLIKGYFGNQIQKIQGSSMKINLFGVIICYIFMITGINYFIIKENRSIKDAFLLGLIIYGTFDFTNLALFDNWSIITSIIDTLWGGILFASTTFVVKKINNK
jgi:uncharacterized membrane protein